MFSLPGKNKIEIQPITRTNITGTYGQIRLFPFLMKLLTGGYLNKKCTSTDKEISSNDMINPLIILLKELLPIYGLIGKKTAKKYAKNTTNVA